MTAQRDDTAQVVPRIPLNVRFRRYQGQFIVYGYEHAVQLDPPADFVWRCIDGVASVCDIAEKVSEEYAIDVQTALDDIVELVNTLAGQGLLELVPSSAAHS